MQSSSSHKSDGLLGLFSLCAEMLLNRGKTCCVERRQTGGGGGGVSGGGGTQQHLFLLG